MTFHRKVLSPPVPAKQELYIARRESGFHISFDQPYNVMEKCTTGKGMELLFEWPTKEGHHMYFTKKEDDSIEIGKRNLGAPHHRQNFFVPRNIKIYTGQHVLTLDAPSSGTRNKVKFIYDGVDVFQGLHFAQLADNIFEKCTKVLSGYEKWGVVNDKMRQFKVLEMHQYNSTTAQQIFSPVDSFTLPAYIYIGPGGVATFTGTFQGREKPTDKIDVYYDGQVVTSLKGAQQKAQAMVAMKFYIHRIAIHLEGSKHKPHVINRVSATKQAGADSLTKLNPIRIGRNLTLTHVYVNTGLYGQVI